MKHLLLFVFAIFALYGNAQSSTVYSVSPNNSNLTIIDSSDFSSVTIPMSSSFGGFAGCNGLAIDPSDPCETIYIVYQATGGRRLGTLNPANGVVTDIGALGDNVANIAFTTAGVLYAVTGDGANIPETLYTVNTATAAMTLVTALGNGDDGESIEYNPDDGLMYHWSGWGAPITMESIDLNTLTITNITLSGSALDNVGASVYIGNNTFLVSDVNIGGLSFVTTTGVVSATANTNSTAKGLVMVDDNVDVLVSPSDTICSGETATFSQNSTGANLGWYQDGVATNDTSGTYTTGTAGVYTLVMNIGGCDYVSPPINLIVNPVPNVNLLPGTSATYCVGDSVELTVSGGTNADFQWYLNGSSIAGADSNVYFANSPGVYNCTKSNGFGCTDSSATGITVTESISPTVNVFTNGSLTFCSGGSVDLFVDTAGLVQYQWYMDGAVIVGATTNSYNATTSGIYNCMGTNNQGCSDSAAVGLTVTVFDLPTVGITPSGSAQFCEGDSVELVASSGAQYQWYMDGNAISGATSSSYFVSANESYNCIVTGANGCSDSSAVATFVNESATPIVTLTPSGTVNFCPGNGPVTITADAGLAVEFYQWYFNGNTLLMATMNAYMGDMEGTYNCIITSSAGCSDSASIAVTLIDTCNANVGNLDASGILVYPNPTSDFIHIDLTDFGASNVTGMMLVSSEGRLVYKSEDTQDLEASVQIDVSDQMSGVYFLIIDTDSERFMKEIKIE